MFFHPAEIRWLSGVEAIAFQIWFLYSIVMKTINRMCIRRTNSIHLFLLPGILIFHSFLPDFTFSQNGLYLLARPAQDSIMLRWAPSNYERWKHGSMFGYKIERITLISHDALIPNFIPEVIAEKILPCSLSDFEKLAEYYVSASIYAQALYGADFEADYANTNNIRNIIDRITVDENRYSFALFAADQEWAVAKSAGLGYTDKDVRKDEKYLYRITFYDGRAGSGDTAQIISGVDEFLPLPKPNGVEYQCENNVVKIIWPVRFLKEIYTSWMVEKSTNGGRSFAKCESVPIVQGNSREENGSEYLIYADSLSILTETSYYRVRGKTSFGELGPASDSIAIRYLQANFPVPVITESGLNHQNLPYLAWKIQEGTSFENCKFYILRSGDWNKNFDTIHSSINFENRLFTDVNPKISNYYKVVVKNADRYSSESSVVFIQLNDTIAPESPSGIKAIMDSCGHVFLSWKPSQEKDFYGYLIYRSNSIHEEPSRITPKPIKDNVFIDSVGLRTCSRELFYHLMAVDNRQNQSPFSIPFKLIRHDIVPPSAPVIVSYKIDSKGVYLRWEESVSSDIAQQIIFIQNISAASTDSGRKICLKPNLNEYVDTVMISGQFLSYCIYVIDSAGNKSINSNSVKIFHEHQYKEPTLTRIDVDRRQRCIVLKLGSADTISSRINRCLVYRCMGRNTFTLYKSFHGFQNTWKDFGLLPGNRYGYTLRFQYANGNLSSFSNVLFAQY